MKKILYIPSGNNLSIYNNFFCGINEKVEITIIYFNTNKWENNKNLNTWKPYRDSLYTFFKELKSEYGLDPINFNINNYDDPIIEEIIKNIKMNYDEIIIDEEFTKEKLKIGKLKYTKNYQYKDFSFGTAKKGSEVLSNLKWKKPNKNLFFKGKLKLNEKFISKITQLSGETISLEYLINICKNNKDYDKIRDIFLGGNRISPFINTGFIPIELLSQYIKGKSHHGIRRELAFRIISINKMRKLNCFDFDNLIKSNQGALDNYKNHKEDKRKKTFSWNELEGGKTDSYLFNFLTNIAKKTGYFNNRGRMWWISWLIGYTNTYKEAYDFAIYFQNKYCSDSRDFLTYYATFDGFKKTPKREEPVWGQAMRMVEDNCIKKMGGLDFLIETNNKINNNEITFRDIYHYNQ